MSQNPLPLKPCPSCQHFRNSPAGQKCTAPKFVAPEPLFWAVLKCGENRDWWKEKVK